MNKSFYIPAEWHTQSAIQLTWPHENTDWDYMLEEIVSCYTQIAKTILQYQRLVIVCRCCESVEYQLNLSPEMRKNLILVELTSNDTWSRDHGGISAFDSKDNKYILDFTFNGWGLKFPSNYDNQITRGLFSKSVFSKEVNYVNLKDFVLEGGSIELDGKGTLLTTTECLLSPNRNSSFTKSGIEKYLLNLFKLKKVLWLDHGYLLGDDTDSHIDTLARFCDEHTIAYVRCEDRDDEHYLSLLKMEEQLKSFTNYEGKPYKLIPLPMADKVIDNGERLPATYANFLIMNDIVLIPFYKSNKDAIAQEQLTKAFPGKQVLGIDCLPIIKQHGSLHCITMQYPEGFIK